MCLAGRRSYASYHFLPLAEAASASAHGRRCPPFCLQAYKRCEFDAAGWIVARLLRGLSISRTAWLDTDTAVDTVMNTFNILPSSSTASSLYILLSPVANLSTYWIAYSLERVQCAPRVSIGWPKAPKLRRNRNKTPRVPPRHYHYHILLTHCTSSRQVVKGKRDIGDKARGALVQARSTTCDGCAQRPPISGPPRSGEGSFRGCVVARSPAATDTTADRTSWAPDR